MEMEMKVDSVMKMGKSKRPRSEGAEANRIHDIAKTCKLAVK
jgi:hypothetical protein